MSDEQDKDIQDRCDGLQDCILLDHDKEQIRSLLLGDGSTEDLQAECCGICEVLETVALQNPGTCITTVRIMGDGVGPCEACRDFSYRHPEVFQWVAKVSAVRPRLDRWVGR